ncbi:MAG: cobalamin biosynthesis protein CbiD [Deltaproteobacteria bacterium]|nr:cobalamin biosynthesis protein CbiD [Deltaproteobacteria bacterium]
MKERKRQLRKGFTTGACAAAGAKAAAQALFASVLKRKTPGKTTSIEVTLPSGREVRIKVKGVEVFEGRAVAAVVKDAGDDPDVTNGADIVTEVSLAGLNGKRRVVRIGGGEGVGVVTRPGLKVPVGRPAINPVPLAMIKTAVFEAASQAGVTPSVRVTVSVPKGRMLAAKTMNPRLGIIGGLSILGTTGIVEPLSLSAYRDSIACAIDVALAAGSSTAVFSTGRTSERAVETSLKLLPAAFILTGDHMGFALKGAGLRRGLKKIIIAGQFGNSRGLV